MLVLVSESHYATCRANESLVTIPKYAPPTVLDGFNSKIIVTDFTFGKHSLLYSTAEVLSTVLLDGVSTIAFWVPTGESGEVAFKGFKSGKVVSNNGNSKVTFHEEKKALVVAFTQKKGLTIIELDGGKVRVLLLDRTAAYHFWVPQLGTDPYAPDDKSVFVQGPYLVRWAEIKGHSTLALSGDLDSSSDITVFAPAAVKTVTWNGTPVRTTRAKDGSLVGSLRYSKPKVALPALTKWKSAEGLPEKQTHYIDSGAAWKVANDTTTPNPKKPYTLPVLYADQYGFHTGISLYRTNVTGKPTSVTFGLQGGLAFGFSVFLNNVHIGSYLGNGSLGAQNSTFAIKQTVLRTDANVNTLLVVTDNSGHDLRGGALDPRGILLATVTGGSFGTWKIAGTAGGEANIDPIRGPLAEGGLTSERLGWHLPGFDSSSWNSTSPFTGKTGAGVTFYKTTAKLSVPAGLDVSVVFTLNVPSGSTTHLRSILWVNGYQFGLFNPYIGNQIEFPVPTGILNLNGENTIAVSVWSQHDSEPARVEVGWKTAYVHETGYDFGFDASALRPAWNKSRLVYA